jgi:hypothetical protein
MKNMLYIVGIIFIIGWGAGILIFHAGGAIHLLLLTAVIAILINFIQGKNAL